MKTTYINTHIVTMDSALTVFPNGYITVEAGTITAINSMDNYNNHGESIVDMNHTICMPGLVNAHTHLGLMPLRSLADDMPDRLRRFLFPMEQKYMTKNLTVLASKYSAYESLLNGTTTVADMYYYADDVAEALAEVGIRALVGQTIIDSSQIDYKTEDEALQQSEKLIHRWQNHPTIQPMIAPHGSTTVSESTLVKIQKLSHETDTRVMMHICEMDYEMDHFKPKTPISYLYEKGIIDHNFIAVHAIHTTQEDHTLLKKAHANVVHCPGANMKAGKGIADIKGMLQAGVTVALGTDGPVSGNTLDIMSLMKLSAIAQKTRYRERDLLPSIEILKMATINGAKTLGIDSVTGSLDIGKRADLLFVDTTHVNMYPIYDVYASLVYQMQPQNVHTVIVDGTVRVQNHQLCTDDLRNIQSELNQSIEMIRKDMIASL